MKTISAAQTAQLLSLTASTMVLYVSADTMAGSLSFHEVSHLGIDAVDELRFSGSVSMVADSSVLAERDQLRLAMQRLAVDLPGAHALHGEAILFDAGDVVARTSATSVIPAEPFISAELV